MAFFTDFGDAAVVFPLALIVALVLGVLGWWRGLLAWVAAVGGTLGAMLGLKLATLLLAEAFDWEPAASPSGHVASTCMVYGGLAVLLLRGRLPLPVLAAIPAVIAVTMSYSRLELHAHSLGEVVVGSLVGLAGVAGLAWMAGPCPRLVNWPVLGAAGCTVLLFHGLHLPAEAAIRSAFAQ